MAIKKVLFFLRGLCFCSFFETGRFMIIGIWFSKVVGFDCVASSDRSNYIPVYSVYFTYDGKTAYLTVWY